MHPVEIVLQWYFCRMTSMQRHPASGERGLFDESVRPKYLPMMGAEAWNAAALFHGFSGES